MKGVVKIFDLLKVAGENVLLQISRAFIYKQKIFWSRSLKVLLKKI